MQGGRVASVQPGSIAEEAGIEPGDLIVSLNGHPLNDIIDYRFYSAEEEVEILVRRGDEEAVVSVEKDIDEPIGVDFDDELFDGVRECGNSCVFCFVHQLPGGMRRSLYLRDDDYRLSFLVGNFVTLTNVAEADLQRILEQRLTPLYVSVHTTDPELRRQMTRDHDAPDIMHQIKTLTGGGITLHTQIVLCPGLNDGEELERTVRDLAAFYPQVASIGVVPVGLTKHRKSLKGVSSVHPEGARRIISAVKGWQKEFKASLGTRLVWASDELYLSAGVKVPSARAYEGFPQIENGIGLVRKFIDNGARVAGRLPESIPHPLKATIVTSVLAAPIVKQFADVLNRVKNLHVTVRPVQNHFFGETVTVAGLITGQDVIDQLKHVDIGDKVLVPAVMLRDGVFLDDVTLEQVSHELGVDVKVCRPLPTGIVGALVLP